MARRARQQQQAAAAASNALTSAAGALSTSSSSTLLAKMRKSADSSDASIAVVQLAASANHTSSGLELETSAVAETSTDLSETAVSVPGVMQWRSSTLNQSAASPRHASLAARLQDWAEMRDRAVEEARREANSSLAAALPFQPNVDRVTGARGDASLGSPRGQKPVPENSREEDQEAIAAGAPRAAGNNNITVNDSNGSSFAKATELTERLQDQARQAQARLDELRRQRNEELRNECTFSPLVTPLALEVSSKVADTTEAQRLRQVDSDYRRIEAEQDDAECTFHPVIGEMSRRIFEASRADEGQQDVYDRLYSQSMGAQILSTMQQHPPQNRAKRGAPGGGGGGGMTRRRSLSQQQGGAVEKNSAPIARLQDVIDEHAFYEMSVLRQKCGAEQERPGERTIIATFLQNILQGETRKPPLATKFASSNFIQHQGGKQNNDDDDDNGDDDSPKRLRQQQGSPQSARRPPRISSARAAAHVHAATVGRESRRSFDEFLERQSQAHQHRATRVEKLARELAPTYQPQVCQHSHELMRDRGPSDHQHGTRRSGSLPGRRSNYVDACTFKPVITKAGESAASRSSSELYQEAERRRERLLEQQQLKDAAAMDGVTFKPRTNAAKNIHVESLLTPRNLDQYKLQVDRQREALDERRRRQEEQSLEAEVMECTFRPRTNRTPAYIARMASSFAIVRDSDLTLSSCA